MYIHNTLLYSLVNILYTQAASVSNLQKARVVLDNRGKEGPEIDENLLTEPLSDVLLQLHMSVLAQNPLDKITEIIDVDLALWGRGEGEYT